MRFLNLISLHKLLRNFINRVIHFAEVVVISEDALRLRHAYLKTEIVTAKYSNDVLYVTLAAISNYEII